MPTMIDDKWMGYFFKIAKTISEQSKDPSTKVGAVIVSNERQILSTGYNGFPVGVMDTEERYNDRPTKLKMVVHAEANAICQAAKHGVSVKDCIIFVTLPPCIDCAKFIIQAGIKTVYFMKENVLDDKCDTVSESDEKKYIDIVEFYSEDTDVYNAFKELNDPQIKCYENSSNGTPMFQMPKEHLTEFIDNLDNVGVCAYPFMKSLSKALKAKYPDDDAFRDYPKSFTDKFIINPNITKMELAPDDGSVMIFNSSKDKEEDNEYPTPIEPKEEVCNCDHEWRDKINDSLNLLTEAGVQVIACS